jgi:multiple sugar transport system ATP-binding protein
VVLVSPLGSEQYVNVQVGDVELVVRAPKEARIAPGDRIGIALQPARAHLFDALSDETLKGPV